jgi:hypothetical protein
MDRTVAHLRSARSLNFRIFADGVVVFVTPTCETHLLSSELAPLFRGEPVEVEVFGHEQAVLSGREIDSSTRLALPAQVINQLVDLKVLERVS